MTSKYPPMLVAHVCNGTVMYANNVLLSGVREGTRDFHRAVARAFMAKGQATGIVTVLKGRERVARVNIERDGA